MVLCSAVGTLSLSTAWIVVVCLCLCHYSEAGMSSKRSSDSLGRALVKEKRKRPRGLDGGWVSMFAGVCVLPMHFFIAGGIGCPWSMIVC